MSEVRNGIYLHFKGRRYKVFGVVPDASALKPGEAPRPPLVFYQALYGDFAYLYRTLDDFTEIVDRPEFDYKGPRFAYIRPL